MESVWDLNSDFQLDSDMSEGGNVSLSKNNSVSGDDVDADDAIAIESVAFEAQLGTLCSDVELLDYVEDSLNCGEKSNAIAESLCMTRNSLSRRLKTMGWGGVYHSIGIEEVVTAITTLVPIGRGGCNWGIRTVAASLRSFAGLRVPGETVWNALVNMQPEHMRRRQVRALFRGQYDITEPMILWHMDCEWEFILPHSQFLAIPIGFFQVCFLFPVSCNSNRVFPSMHNSVRSCDSSRAFLLH